MSAAAGDGPEHVLVLTGHPVYDWELRCQHAVEGWRTYSDEDGTDVESDECWLISWWDNDGRDLICDDGVWPTPTTNEVPIDVKGNGWDGVRFVPHDPNRCPKCGWSPLDGHHTKPSAYCQAVHPDPIPLRVTVKPASSSPAPSPETEGGER